MDEEGHTTLTCSRRPPTAGDGRKCEGAERGGVGRGAAPHRHHRPQSATPRAPYLQTHHSKYMSSSQLQTASRPRWKCTHRFHRASAHRRYTVLVPPLYSGWRRGAPPRVPLTTLPFYCPTGLARLTFSPWVRLRGVLVVLPEDQARERQVHQDDGTSGACVASRLHCSAGTPTGSDYTVDGLPLSPPARGLISQEVLAYAVMD